METRRRPGSGILIHCDRYSLPLVLGFQLLLGRLPIAFSRRQRGVLRFERKPLLQLMPGQLCWLSEPGSRGINRFRVAN